MTTATVTRFRPVQDDDLGFWQHDGTVYATVGEDCENVLILTADQDTAMKVAAAHFHDVGIDLADVDFDAMRALWAVFEYMPETPDYLWQWSPAAEGDDQAVPVHYLPA